MNVHCKNLAVFAAVSAAMILSPMNAWAGSITLDVGQSAERLTRTDNVSISISKISHLTQSESQIISLAKRSDSDFSNMAHVDFTSGERDVNQPGIGRSLNLETIRGLPVLGELETLAFFQNNIAGAIGSINVTIRPRESDEISGSPITSQGLTAPLPPAWILAGLGAIGLIARFRGQPTILT